MKLRTRFSNVINGFRTFYFKMGQVYYTGNNQQGKIQYH